MLTARDALAKALVKSQKVTVWSQKMALYAFFFANYCRCSKTFYKVNTRKHQEKCQSTIATDFNFKIICCYSEAKKRVEVFPS